VQPVVLKIDPGSKTTGLALARLEETEEGEVVPAGFAAYGTHTGRIAVRANKQFRMGKVQGIPARFCRVLQLADGYDYAVVETTLHV
jgi:hypothetical protein